MEKKGCIVFDTKEFHNSTAGLRVAQCMKKGKTSVCDALEESIAKKLEELVVADARSCSCCSMQFTDTASQRAHFKLDWHRFNIKRQLKGFGSIREDAFDSLADQDEVESISGSESESEEEEGTEDTVSPNREEISIPNPSVDRHTKVFFENALGQVVSVHRCLLTRSKDSAETLSDLVNEALKLNQLDTWAIIMLGGGHFAAGIFKGLECSLHKTFHCYTVRAKQGGSQSSRDNRGGSHPKSAGASLRRYNEQSLIQHVQDVISQWKESLKSCHLIFYRAVGPHNRSVLFGGKNPPLDKNDSRLRRIPFPTRRATYSEVKRVHDVLSFMEFHGHADDFQGIYPQSPERKPVSVKSEKMIDPLSEDGNHKGPKRGRSYIPNRAKSRPSLERPLPSCLPYTSSDSEAISGNEMVLNYETVEMGFSKNLREYEDSLSFESNKSKKSEKTKKSKIKSPVGSKVVVPAKCQKSEEKQKVEKSKGFGEEKQDKIAQKKEKKALAAAAAALRKQQEEEEAKKNPVLVFQNALGAAIQSGCLSELQNCLSDKFLDVLPSSLPGSLKNVLNLPLTGGNTPLHVASKAGFDFIIRELMSAGADPSVLNKKSQPPYALATCKEARDAFMEFRVNHPDLFDYTCSRIPSPLTEDEEKEKLERKAAQVRAKREREKEKRKAQAVEKAETEAKERFLALSDREKRALAAERRLLQAQRRGAPGEKSVVLTRCFTCAEDITGKTPFEYEQFRFCSFECLKTHRLKSKKSL